MYLAWFDADRKKPVATKIAEAHERYVAKFGRQPLVCLVNPEDASAEAAIELRPLQSIGRNCFWIGTDEDQEQQEAVAMASVPAATATATAGKQPRRSRKKATEAAQSAPPAQVLEMIAPPSALSSVIATTVEAAPTAPARPRRGRKVAPEAAPEIAPTPPAPVSVKRRSRRERPAA